MIRTISNTPKATMSSHRDGEISAARGVLRRAWNQRQATGVVNGHNRIITPFRAVNNLGDFLSRKNYVCGGPNQVSASRPGWKGSIGSIISQCDDTNVEGYSGNVKFVPDSSDYTTYKKQRELNINYNDPKH
tara:strand:+ start:9749 stop:10144 length:396 start_codon:yes stop_codon:yes gene_type:complete